MPWQGTEPQLYEFFSVINYIPQASGVYAIFSGETYIYVGETGNLCTRLLQHVNGVNTCIARHRPTHFAYELVAPHGRRERQRELSQEFQPVCNKRVERAASVR